MTTNVAVMVEQELRRFMEKRRLHPRSLVLGFAPELEAIYSSGTKAARLGEISLTIPMGIGFYMSTAITDPIFLPDLGFEGTVLRIIALVPLLFLLVVAARIEARTVEKFLTVAAIVAVIGLGGIVALSSAPLASYAFATVYLAFTYANTTVPLRFHLACCSTAICGAVLILLIFSHDRISVLLAEAMSLQVIIAGLFSLFACYRIEHGARLSYLLSAREAERVSGLAADRQVLTVLSSTDALTGLANRGQFDRHLAALTASPARAGERLGLLMIDVDHFKRYNDRYGHVAGDACLRTIADVLAETVRGKDDLAARFGGEEFVILLLDTAEGDVRSIACRLCEAVAARALPHANRDDGIDVVTISIGVAVTVLSGVEDADALIERADRSLYVAKGRGRNRVASDMAMAA